MKKVFLFLFAINFINMDYKVLNWEEAIELKNKESGEFFMSVKFNDASVYKLKDSSLLVMPLNPFGKSLLTKREELVKEWINKSFFPTNEKQNQFYFDNKDLIDNLKKVSDSLQEQLFDYTFNKSESNLELNYEQKIERVYKKIKENNQLKKYKLNFIVLVGNYLIKNNPDYAFGIVESRQLLNPVKSIILIEKNTENVYFELEDWIFGNNRFTDVKSIIFAFNDFKKRTNDFETIYQIGNVPN